VQNRQGVLIFFSIKLNSLIAPDATWTQKLLNIFSFHLAMMNSIHCFIFFIWNL